MRVTHLALGQHWLDPRPCLALRSIAQEVHNNGAFLYGLIDLEQILPGYPTILLSLLPALAVLPYTNDDIEAIVTEVQALTVTLRTVADERESVVLEVVEKLVARPVVALFTAVSGSGLKEVESASSPKTFSFEPAKSIVFAPLVWMKLAAGFCAERSEGLLAFTAETKVRCWTRGLLNCLSALLRALVVLREVDMVTVLFLLEWRWYQLMSELVARLTPRKQLQEAALKLFRQSSADLACLQARTCGAVAGVLAGLNG